MVGIGARLNSSTSMTPPAQAGAAQQPAPESGAGQESAQASPEEQAQYDLIVNTALEVMLDETKEAFRPQIQKDMQGQFDPQMQQLFADAQPPLGQVPVDPIAGTSAIIALMTRAVLMGRGEKIDGGIFMQAGQEIVAVVADTSAQVGLKDYSDEEIESAYLRALDLFRTTLTPEEQRELAAQFEEIVEADRQGNLEQVLPGASKFAGAAQPQPQPQQAGMAQ